MIITDELPFYLVGLIAFESIKSKHSLPTAANVNPEARPRTVARDLLFGKMLLKTAHKRTEPKLKSTEPYAQYINLILLGASFK